MRGDPISKIQGDLCAWGGWKRKRQALSCQSTRDADPQPQLGDAAHLLPTRQHTALESRAGRLRGLWGARSPSCASLVSSRAAPGPVSGGSMYKSCWSPNKPLQGPEGRLRARPCFFPFHVGPSPVPGCSSSWRGELRTVLPAQPPH